MATVTTPFGTSFEEKNPVALAYYKREEGYSVDDAPAPVSTTKSTPPPPPAPPAPPAS